MKKENPNTFLEKKIVCDKNQYIVLFQPNSTNSILEIGSF